jgi:hypothetical protein
VVAEDNAGNISNTVPTVPSSATTRDFSPPIFTSNISLTLGEEDNTSQITFGNLEYIVDEQEDTPTVTVICNIVDDFAESNGATYMDATGVDSFTVTGLDSGVVYYGWVVAQDSFSNATPPTACVPPSILTMDVLPPVGLSNVSINLGNPESSVIRVNSLAGGVVDNVGVAHFHLYYSDSNVYEDSTLISDIPGSTSSYNITGLDDATVYHVWVTAEDLQNNVSDEEYLGSLITADATAPMFPSQLEVSEGTYEFSITGGSIVDNSSGILKAYLVLTDLPKTQAELVSELGNGDGSLDIGDNITESNAKYTNSSYVADTVLDRVGDMSGGLSSRMVWNGSSFIEISETYPTNHELYAHLYAVDPSGLVGVAEPSRGPLDVSDVTPPSYMLGFPMVRRT